jgi:hypothetical protein
MLNSVTGALFRPLKNNILSKNDENVWIQRFGNWNVQSFKYNYFLKWEILKEYLGGTL